MVMANNDRTARIRQRAFEIWENEGRPHGLDQTHWLRAEAEIGGDIRTQRPGKKLTRPTQKPMPKTASPSKPSSKSSKKRTSKS
jgi:hypothetical protein